LYSFHDSYGNTSNATSNAREVSDDPARAPKTLPPFDFSVRHRGTAFIIFNGSDDDPILDGTELFLLLNVSSGHPYTRIEKLKYLGASGPWTLGVRPLQDVRVADPVEPLNSSITPWIMSLDLRLSKEFVFTDIRLQISMDVLNLLDSKNILNVYPTTGSTTDDSWLSSTLAENFKLIPNYESFYRDINLKNGWEYVVGTGNSMYGTPRQVRLGLRVWM
jgi:hypothetical protein